MRHLEKVSSFYGFFIEYDEVLEEDKSDFQDIKLVYSKDLGKILLLDGIVQLIEKYEWQYHEIMSFYPFLCKDQIEKVLIIGGGDGVIAKNVLTNPVQKVDLVELDSKVVEFSKTHLKSINNGAFEDKRINLIIKDAREFVSKSTEKYDLIIMDMTDPLGPSKPLYTKEFYTIIKSMLQKEGIFIMHSESLDLKPYVFSSINKTLKSVFAKHCNIFNYVLMYGTFWSYAMCSNDFSIEQVNKQEVFDRLSKINYNFKIIDSETFFSLRKEYPYFKELSSGGTIISDGENF